MLRIIGCFFLIIILCCLGSVFILVARPPVVVTNVANIIADDSIMIDESSKSFAEISRSLNDQVVGVGFNRISITEADLNILIKERTSNENIYIDLSENQVTFLYKIDDKPLYAFAKTTFEADTVVINQSGVGKIHFPNFVSGLANKLLEKYASEIKLDVLLNEHTAGIRVTGIEVQESLLIVDINFDPQIF